METRLIIFAVIALHALVGLVLEDTLRTVFGKAQLDIGILRVKFIQPLVDRMIGLHIPAEIEIVALQVRNPVHRRGCAAHHYLRRG